MKCISSRDPWRRTKSSARRGSATFFAGVALVMVVGLAVVILSVSYRHSGETTAEVQENRAFFVAQAGVQHALNRIGAGDQTPIGFKDERIPFSGGSYWVDVIDNGDATRTVNSYGRMGLKSCAIEVVLRMQAGGIYHNGLFAGNSSADPDYTLELGGSGAQSDEVIGDVYSGGDVRISGDARVDGTIRSYGTAEGNGSSSAETGRKQPIPDIAGMNYEVTADVKVADEFATGGATFENNAAGGSAWQLAETNPAHIFRKNPDNRSSVTSTTAKDDYFLEDPYENINLDPDRDGSDPTEITLSGISGEPGTSSNQKVFFIDGNLWLHNKSTYSFKFAHEDSAGIQVTFVVKGNIYLCDSIYYENSTKDGLAFIAMKDPDEPDSGNVYLGDPDFGTLRTMEAFLYAEEDFYDVNLDASGSMNVELLGNMTAGDHVLITRDFDTGTVVDGLPVIQHSKLKIDWDDRIATGELDMPGLPESRVTEENAYEVLSWREVPAD
jgi:hypothetical protein